MIRRLAGKIIERQAHGLIMQVNGIGYEVLVPAAVLSAIEETSDGEVELVTYHYMQLDPAKAVPVLVGFRNELERDFFQQFIQVASIGPRSAVKALALPISQIAEAIETGDASVLKRLPGIGAQKAKEIVAKLQGKAGRFCLIRDGKAPAQPVVEDIQGEALDILTGVGHKRAEARQMIRRAVEHEPPPQTVEDLLNLAYRLRKKPESGSAGHRQE